MKVTFRVDASLAIGIGHVKHITLTQLQKIIPKYKEMGYEFVKLSEIVR